MRPCGEGENVRFGNGLDVNGSPWALLLGDIPMFLRCGYVAHSDQITMQPSMENIEI